MTTVHDKLKLVHDADNNQYIVTLINDADKTLVAEYDFWPSLEINREFNNLTEYVFPYRLKI